MKSKVAALQMTSSPSVADNLSLVEQLIHTALQQKSELIVLPEMFPIAGLETSDKLKVSETFGHGPIQEFLAQQAKKNKLWIIGGTIPLKTDQPNKIRAASLVFNDGGELVGRYDKIHLFDVKVSETESYQESAVTEAGSELTLIDSPFGKIGLSVCYDLRFPELFRQLFNRGAEIFAIPAAFTVKTGQAHWEVLTRSRAIENFCYVIGAGQTGTQQNGRKTYGHSLIINPWGEIMNSLPEGTGVISAEIDLNQLKQFRQNIPVDLHQRFFVNSAR